MEFPFVGVSVELEGASPSAMEDEVVDPLEEAFATIEGVRHIRSESGQGQARVMLEFELEHDLDTAAQDVRDKLNASMRRLPRDDRAALARQGRLLAVPDHHRADRVGPARHGDDRVRERAHQARAREHPGRRGRPDVRRARAQHPDLDRPRGAARARSRGERRARRAAPRARRAAGRLRRRRTPSSGRSRPTPSSDRWRSSRT